MFEETVSDVFCKNLSMNFNMLFIYIHNCLQDRVGMQLREIDFRKVYLQIAGCVRTLFRVAVYLINIRLSIGNSRIFCFVNQELNKFNKCTGTSGKELLDRYITVQKTFELLSRGLNEIEHERDVNMNSENITRTNSSELLDNIDVETDCETEDVRNIMSFKLTCNHTVSSCGERMKNNYTSTSDVRTNVPAQLQTFRVASTEVCNENALNDTPPHAFNEDTFSSSIEISNETDEEIPIDI